MADPVALGIKPPDNNGFVNTLQTLSQLGQQSAHTGLLGTEAELNRRRLNALQQYGTRYSAGDPDAAQELAQFPEIQKQVQESTRQAQEYKALDTFAGQGGGSQNIGTLNAFPGARETIANSLRTMTEQQKDQTNFNQDQVARTAWNAKNSQQWDEGINNLIKQGVLNPDIGNQFIGKFSPQLREQVIDHAMNMRDILETHGIPQGAAAAAIVPSQIKVEQARPIAVSPNEGVIIPNSGGSGASSSSSPAPSGVTQPPNASSAPQGGKFFNEIPVAPLSSQGPQKSGTVIAPKSISQVGAEQAAVERAKQIDEQAAAATTARGQLATLNASLDSGFTTNASAPARAVASAWANALLGHDAATAITGIDPVKADVFNKDATRMGLEYARSTEGSRESMMAIRTALGANPQMAATTQGNKAIINIMDQTARWQQDQQQAKDDYFLRNQHYVGFGSWWNNAHPVSEYISKALPFPLPVANGKVNSESLKPNTTYNIPGKGPHIWNGQSFDPGAPQ